MITIAETVLGGLLVATGGVLVGKLVTNKNIIERLDKMEDKISQKLDRRIRIKECDMRHHAMEQVVNERFDNISKQITTVIQKIDKLNNK